ncbi:MAG: hypothetical protein Q4C63_01625 [Eubacteriales bacterium]|nr:hypothetical protein [Eubacteriales bacterium]
MKILPQEYLDRMRGYLGASFDSFLHSYDEPPKKGLRFHTDRIRKETMERLIGEWHLRKVPWCETGYYYEETGPFSVRPGRSPYHDAGLYYIQEPSAMLPGALAAPEKTDAVLDLCAAPGGKTTQTACSAGFVLSNEYVRKRAQILSSNVERMGLANVIVTSASAGALSALFPEFFDVILVDAPCSGEGMMRRDEIAVSEWSSENVVLCARRQEEILEEAYRMLRPGGRLVYSTCTFEPSENGGQAERFLSRHRDLALLSEETLYPHLCEGEGHYCAVFRRSGEAGGSKEGQEEALKRLRRARIPILRAGVEPGEWIAGKHRGEKRYEPSHAEALALRSGDLEGTCFLNLLSEHTALSYLRGESLNLDVLPEDSYALHAEGKNAAGDTKGYLPVCYDGYPLGWGKLVGRTVKNHYPKGLRRMS